MIHASIFRDTIKVAIGVGIQSTKWCFNLLPFGIPTSKRNEFGRILIGQEIIIPYTYSSNYSNHIPSSSNKSKKWTKDQLNQLLLSCGDVEANPGHPDFLKCMQLNCNGWKLNEIEHILAIEKPDVFMIQETKLDAIKQSSIRNYHIARRDRTTARQGIGATVKGGGLVTLIRDDEEARRTLSIIEMPELNLGEDNVTEVLQIKVVFNKRTIVFSNIYKPPIRPNVNEQRDPNHFKADNVLGKCLSSCIESEHIVGGDLNAHHTVWDNIAANDPNGEDILEFCMDSHMNIENNGAVTYMARSDARKSTPDITLSSSGLVVNNWATLSATTSDHLPITFDVYTRNNGEKEMPIPINNKRTNIAWKKADWTKYNNKLRSLIKEWPANAPDNDKNEWNKKGGATNMHLRSKRLNHCLKLAARILPQGARKDPVIWWHEEIDEASRIRDLLGEEAHVNEENRIEWVQACQEVVNIIKRRRLEYWKDFNTKYSYTSNPGKVAAVIKSINREQRTSTNIAIVTDKGKLLTKDHDKATAFLGQFSKVSANTHNKETRSKAYRVENREEKIRASKYSSRPCHSPQASAFSSTELDAQLQNLQLKRAPGEDGIHNEMLINLEGDMRAELLDVINMSWSSGISPSSWLCGVIIPIRKPGKDKITLSSYRPVCLMSNVAKLAERLVVCRLRYDLESRNILSPMQSGFRSGRSTADPLLRLISDIQGGLNRPAPAQRTVAALLDLSKAFDKVVHQKLLCEMDNLEIPSCYGNWYRGFLWDRRYRVRYGFAVSKFCRFANGVPQGSGSGPLLFIIIANTLSVALTPLIVKGVNHGLIADDTTLWSTQINLIDLATSIQEGLNIAIKWSIKYRMPLNMTKTDLILFTNHAPDHEVPLGITMGGIQVEMSKEVRLLGVILDSALTFKPHVDKIQKLCHSRLRQLSTISGYNWGGNARDQRSTYFAFVNSILTYCGSIFYPFLSETNKGKLQRIQNTSARIITGCVRSTNIEALLLEANLEPLSVGYEKQCAVMGERARRMGEGDPLTIMASKAPPPSRLLKTAQSWEQLSDEILHGCGLRVGRVTNTGNEIVAMGVSVKDQIDIRNRVPIWTGIAPWNTSNAFKVMCVTDLNKKCTNLDPPEVWKAQTENIINLLGPKGLEIFSDGSVVNKRGAGGAQIYDNVKNKTHSVTVPAGNLCSSFKSEIEGVSCGLKLLINNEGIDKQGKSLLLCTDSLALVETMKKGPINQKLGPVVSLWSDIISLLDDFGVQKVDLLWGKGHVGVDKNEKVDILVGKAMAKFEKEKTGASQKKSPILLQGVKAEVNYQLSNAYRSKLQTTGHRYEICGGNFSDLKLSSTLTRQKEVWLNQLRVGKCLLLGSYRSIINIRNSPLCRWCGVVDETVRHVYSECQNPSIMQLRVDLDFLDATVLHKAPLVGLQFFEEILKLL